MPIPQQQNYLVRVSARERICKTLQDWIVSGVLEPGERLNDVEIARYFSVSRTPVREALQLLSEQKLIDVIPSSGTFVSQIDLQDLEKVYSLLGDLQALAVRQAVDNAVESDLARLYTLNDSFLYNARFGSAVDAMQMDSQFHHTLAELSGNPYLVRFTDELMVQAHRNEVRIFKRGDHARHSFDTHRHLVDALAGRRCAEAVSLIRSNWQISLDQP